MPAAVIPIGEFRSGAAKNTPDLRDGHWSLLEIAPGSETIPFGVLLVDTETNQLRTRCRTTADLAELCDLEEQEQDILDCLEEDLQARAGEQGAVALIDSLEDTLSGFLRINDRTAIAYSGSQQKAADRLFEEFVDPEIRRFETHLPLYGLRAAATKFGEGMAAEEPEWIRVWPSRGKASKLTPAMFVAHVVGRSMEPLIPDDSLCVFRANVAGTRQGKYLLIEKFGETDFANRYTVKRYTSQKTQDSTSDTWEHRTVRLEPLNPEFEAFELGPDEFRVIAEFVEVLGPASE
jgi:hypothetical protein